MPATVKEQKALGEIQLFDQGKQSGLGKVGTLCERTVEDAGDGD